MEPDPPTVLRIDSGFPIQLLPVAAAYQFGQVAAQSWYEMPGTQAGAAIGWSEGKTDVDIERDVFSPDPDRLRQGLKCGAGKLGCFHRVMHADTFGLLLVQSGSFWWEPTGVPYAEPNWVAQEFLRRPTLPLRFFLEAGLFEVDLAGRGGNIIETTRHLRDVLVAKGYAVHYQEFAGDHESVNWRGTLADGLVALLGGGQ